MTDKFVVTVAGILLIVAVNWYFLLPGLRRPPKTRSGAMRRP